MSLLIVSKHLNLQLLSKKIGFALTLGQKPCMFSEKQRICPRSGNLSFLRQDCMVVQFMETHLSFRSIQMLPHLSNVSATYLSTKTPTPLKAFCQEGCFLIIHFIFLFLFKNLIKFLFINLFFL